MDTRVVLDEGGVELWRVWDVCEFGMYVIVGWKEDWKEMWEEWEGWMRCFFCVRVSVWFCLQFCVQFLFRVLISDAEKN